MRLFILLAAAGLGALPAFAQEQEKRLIDRLLRPDVTLVNPAQNKAFSSIEGMANSRQFEAKPFYTDKMAAVPKNFWGTKEYRANDFRNGRLLPAQVAATAGVAKAVAQDGDRRFPARESSLGRTAGEANKPAARARDYAGSRPFLARGTRQEQLSAEDRPLTIEEVRDLLNRDR